METYARSQIQRDNIEANVCVQSLILLLFLCVIRLSGATDVVSDVAYHPLNPQIVITCYDGRIRCYTPA
jgi:hypothetical protein